MHVLRLKICKMKNTVITSKRKLSFAKLYPQFTNTSVAKCKSNLWQINLVYIGYSAVIYKQKYVVESNY